MDFINYFIVHYLGANLMVVSFVLTYIAWFINRYSGSRTGFVKNRKYTDADLVLGSRGSFLYQKDMMANPRKRVIITFVYTILKSLMFAGLLFFFLIEQDAVSSIDSYNFSTNSILLKFIPLVFFIYSVIALVLSILSLLVSFKVVPFLGNFYTWTEKTLDDD